ncbi:MAG: SAM-dependent methyltransferase [Hungatella hathewayi]|uniref:class I SAM-dependent methyltransferase n=2 Tax=Hungatella TaxID=1649459 RepID=UPI00110603A9|nr:MULTISPECIES: SAM-dependent methyltransferase [Hungatella]MCI7384724.1 SAM-dependent methyltransferase [Hungatella sp.]MDY6239119.1 SAM-dependent methyltransferase [Hungatella hathewayi]
MDREKREEIKILFEDFLDESLIRIILSNPVLKEGAGPGKVLKVRVRPVMLKGGMVFQAEELTEKQAFHRNLTKEEGVPYLLGLLEGGFKQAEAESVKGQARVMVGKKGTVTVKVKKNQQKIVAAPNVASHNRQKRYILEEGKPVAFLEDLGVMTVDGKVIRSRYDKFRQINRFLEFIEDILPRLDKSRENVIIDFGCGKSYLTFAMYYYLHELRGYEVRIIGLDLKQDVIDRCNRLSEAYGFDKLKFYHGDIASYDGVDHVDMVVTLHACDTATDYALEKAVKWDASVILSVPCCQHELNKQMDNELLRPVFQYGLIKERMAALYTDALRAEILENRGYRTQILEFIDMEHTPKNILIRAVKQGGPKDNRKEIEDILQFLGTEQTLARLLLEDQGI